MWCTVCSEGDKSELRETNKRLEITQEQRILVNVCEMASIVEVNDAMELRTAQPDGHRTGFPLLCFCELHDLTGVIVHSALNSCCASAISYKTYLRDSFRRDHRSPCCLQ